MASQDDFSDLGAVPIDDFSDLGAIPIQSPSKEVSKQESPINNIKNLGNYLFNDNYKSNDWRDPLNEMPDNFITGVKGGVQNLFHGISPSRVSEFHPQGISQYIGDFLGNVGAFAGGGEVLGALGKGIPIARDIIAAGSKLPGWIKRLGSAATYGAINNPQDRGEGATTGLITGGIGEGLGALLGKGLPAAAEFLHPQKYAHDLASDIKKGYQNTKKIATDLYNPVFENVGNKKITNSPYSNQYTSLNKDILRSYSPSIKEVHNDFIKNPTFNNAHKLQSDMGKRIAALKAGNSKDSLTLDNIERLEKAQNALKSDMSSYLGKNNPGLFNKYNEASDFYKNQVTPYNQNNTIRDIVKGRETISPEELRSSLKDLSELKRGNNHQEYLLPQNHYLRETLSNLSRKINRGEAAGTVGSLGSILAGTTLGNILHPGIMGSLLGGALGGTASNLGKRYVMPKVLDLATNPTVHETLPKLKVPYDMLVKSLINAQSGSS